jgi:hypothetical protein
MRIRFSSFTRRPAFLALLAAASMVYLAIYKFDIPAEEVGRAALLSVVLVMAVAVPAGVLVAVIQLIKHIRNKE